MKTFHFRLEQALRWRAAQCEVEKAKVALEAKRLRDIRSDIEASRANLRNAPGQLGPSTSGATLELLAAYTDQTRRRIERGEQAAKKAEQDLAGKTQALIEANRRLKLIENLKQTARTEWNEEFNRELESFAGDTFLGRLQSRKRARSSGG